MNCIDAVLDEAGILEIYNFECGDNMFIAGGACTKLYFQAETLASSDLDIYLSEDNKDLLSSHILDNGSFKLIRQNEIVSTYVNPFTNSTIQLICTCARYAWDPSTTLGIGATLGSFDLSACQMTYIHGSLSGHSYEGKELLDKGLMRVLSYDFRDYTRLLKYLQKYPVKLDLQDSITVSVLERLREGCIVGINRSGRVIDKGVNDYING